MKAVFCPLFNNKFDHFTAYIQCPHSSFGLNSDFHFVFYLFSDISTNCPDISGPSSPSAPLWPQFFQIFCSAYTSGHPFRVSSFHHYLFTHSYMKGLTVWCSFSVFSRNCALRLPMFLSHPPSLRGHSPDRSNHRNHFGLMFSLISLLF